MGTRYIQAAIDSDKHLRYKVFAAEKEITLSDLVEIAVDEYIKITRKEEAEYEIAHTV